MNSLPLYLIETNMARLYSDDPGDSEEILNRFSDDDDSIHRFKIIFDEFQGPDVIMLFAAIQLTRFIEKHGEFFIKDDFFGLNAWFFNLLSEKKDLLIKTDQRIIEQLSFFFPTCLFYGWDQVFYTLDFLDSVRESPFSLKLLRGLCLYVSTIQDKYHSMKITFRREIVHQIVEYSVFQLENDAKEAMEVIELCLILVPKAKLLKQTFFEPIFKQIKPEQDDETLEKIFALLCKRELYGMSSVKCLYSALNEDFFLKAGLSFRMLSRYLAVFLETVHVVTDEFTERVKIFAINGIKKMYLQYYPDAFVDLLQFFKRNPDNEFSQYFLDSVFSLPDPANTFDLHEPIIHRALLLIPIISKNRIANLIMTLSNSFNHFKNELIKDQNKANDTNLALIIRILHAVVKYQYVIDKTGGLIAVVDEILPSLNNIVMNMSERKLFLSEISILCLFEFSLKSKIYQPKNIEEHLIRIFNYLGDSEIVLKLAVSILDKMLFPRVFAKYQDFKLVNRSIDIGINFFKSFAKFQNVEILDILHQNIEEEIKRIKETFDFNTYQLILIQLTGIYEALDDISGFFDIITFEFLVSNVEETVTLLFIKFLKSIFREKHKFKITENDSLIITKFLESFYKYRKDFEITGHASFMLIKSYLLSFFDRAKQVDIEASQQSIDIYLSALDLMNMISKNKMISLEIVIFYDENDISLLLTSMFVSLANISFSKSKIYYKTLYYLLKYEHDIICKSFPSFDEELSKLLDFHEIYCLKCILFYLKNGYMIEWITSHIIDLWEVFVGTDDLNIIKTISKILLIIIKIDSNYIMLIKNKTTVLIPHVHHNQIIQIYSKTILMLQDKDLLHIVDSLLRFRYIARSYNAFYE